MRGLPEDRPVRDGLVQPPDEDVGARVREVLEPRAGDRELTLITGPRTFSDLCGLAWVGGPRLEHICSNPPTYAVTSNAPNRQGLTFLVCVEHAHLARRMKWFESMWSLPRD